MDRRKFIIGVGALGAGTSAALGTGAFTTVQAQRNADISIEGDSDAYLQIEPVGGENSNKYVSQEDETYQLELPKVNQDAVTEVENLLRVANQGTQPVAVYFEDDSDVVTFRVSKSGQSLEGPKNSMELEVGESVEVGLTVDTLDNDVTSGQLLDSVTIHADANPPAPAQGEVAPEAQYVVDGTGNGNKFATISAAIEQAGKSDEDTGDGTVGSVFVEPGTYDESVTVDIEGLRIRGPDTGEAEVTDQVTVNADGVVVDGLTVSPPNPGDDNQGAEAILVSGSADSVTVQNNVVKDFARTSGSDTWEEGIGITGILVFGGKEDDAVESPTVRNNLVKGMKNTPIKGAAGIAVQGNVADATVEQNTVEDIGQKVTDYGFGIVVRGTSNHNVTPTNVVATNNEVANVVSDPNSDASGVGIGVEASGASEVDFAGNSISNVEFLLEDKTATLDLSVFAEDNTLDRGALLNGAKFNGKDPRNVIFDSIGDAVSSAASGDTIGVETGTYDEDVTVGTSVTLSGSNAGTHAAAASRGSEEATINYIDIQASDVTLDGFELNSNGGNAINMNTPASDVTIQNILLTRVSGTGFDDPEGSGTDVAANGINIAMPKNGSGDPMSGLDIKNNKLSLTAPDAESGNKAESTATAVRINMKKSNLRGVDITGNVITDITAGKIIGGDKGDTEARGVTINTAKVSNYGTATDISIENNLFENFEGRSVKAIGLFETKEPNTPVGPENFQIKANEFAELTATTEPPAAIFIGGYPKLGTHSVKKNNIRDGVVVRGFYGQFSSSSGDALNTENNYWGDSGGPDGEDGVENTEDPQGPAAVTGGTASGLVEAADGGHSEDPISDAGPNI